MAESLAQKIARLEREAAGLTEKLRRISGRGAGPDRTGPLQTNLDRTRARLRAAQREANPPRRRTRAPKATRG